MDLAQLRRDYTALLALCQQRKNHAQQQQWETLIQTQLSYQQHIATVSQYGAIETLPAQWQDEFDNTLHAIIALEAETQTLMQAEMAQISHAMKQIKQQRNIHHTYGSI